VCKGKWLRDKYVTFNPFYPRLYKLLYATDCLGSLCNYIIHTFHRLSSAGIVDLNVFGLRNLIRNQASSNPSLFA